MGERMSKFINVLATLSKEDLFEMLDLAIHVIDEHPRCYLDAISPEGEMKIRSIHKNMKDEEAAYEN